MNVKSTSVMVAILMAMAVIPGTEANRFENDSCASPPSGVQCAEVFGPGSVMLKGIVGLGAGVCTLEAGVPFPCGVSGAGAAFFDTTTWSTTNSFREAYVWSEWISGGSALDPGHRITVCNDRDNTGICTNADDVDGFVTAQSNPEQLSLKKDGDVCDKDTKDCADPDDAEAFICVQQDLDGGFDDIVVFVGAWADVGLDKGIGDGTSYGSFQIWFQPGSYRSGFAGAGSGNDCGADYLHQGVVGAQCADGVDNDGDGQVDGADDNCTGPGDNSEGTYLQDRCLYAANFVDESLKTTCRDL